VIEFTSEEIEKLQAEIARRLGYKLVDQPARAVLRSAR